MTSSGGERSVGGERSAGRGRAFGGVIAERLAFSLEASLVAERSRWFLWTPVVFAVGIGIYFALPYEPAAWTGFAVFGAAALFARMVRAILPLFLIVLAVAIGGAGFGIATIRTERVTAPVLENNINRASVTGKVISVESRRVGQRFILADVTIRGLDPANTPKRIRLSDRIGDSGLMPGDLISVRAGVMPPPAPAAPGAFDFARRAWFQGLGGVGFTVSRATIIEGNAHSKFTMAGFMTFVAGLRSRISSRVRDVLPGDTGAVAAALMTGDRGAISDQAMSNVRDSGLAHLLAISGLHIGLFTGLRCCGKAATKCSTNSALKMSRF